MLLNLDAGEREDETEALWSLFDLLNCACGGHAGDEQSMARVSAFCARSGVLLGAHPSYPDREGFGRRSPFEHSHIVPSVQTLMESVAAQCRALDVIARHAGTAVVAVKPHGALYHDAAAHADIASAVIDAATAVLGPRVLIVGPPDGAMRDEAAQVKLRYASEGFADRRMRQDGTLVPRDTPDALVLDHEEAARQARQLAQSVDTICIHGDTPGVLEIARAVRRVVYA